MASMPDPLQDLLRDDHFTAEQVDGALEHVFAHMQEDGDMPKEWIDGACVFAKGVRKRLRIEQ